MKKILLGEDKVSFVRTENKGKPKLLMLHGFMSNSSYFREAIDILKKDFEILAPDFPGFGLSDPFKNKDHSLSTYADLIFRLINFLDFKPFHLLGWSLGGMVGINMSALHQDYINKFIIQSSPYNSKGINIPNVEKILSVFSQSDPLLDFAEGMKSKIDQKAFQTFMAGVNQHYYQIDKRNGAVYYCFKTMKIPVMSEIWKEMKHFSLLDKVKKIRKESLILVGDHDVQVFPEHVERLASYIPGSKFKSVKNGTHAMFWDFPDKMADITREFLVS